MAAHVQGNSNSGGENESSIAVSLTGITAGNLLVVWLTWGTADGAPTLSDGTSSFTAGTKVSISGGYGQFFYRLSANGGNKTITATFSPNVDYPEITVSEIAASSGIWAFDAQNTGTGTSASPASGVINTSGTEEVVFGGCNPANYPDTTSSELINGVAAIEPTYSPAFLSSVWYRLLSATFSNGNASATLPGSQDWVCNIIAFKVVGLSPLPNNYYSTSFDNSEDPISEGGVWLNGAMDGEDWNNVLMTGGVAKGAEQSATYADPTAILKGTWDNDQMVQATVYVGTAPTDIGEVELILRSTMATGAHRGYEITFSVKPTSPYIQLVRRNGDYGDFDILDSYEAYASNGDVIKAKVVGTVIQAWLNSTKVIEYDTVSDGTKFSDGAPGISFYSLSDEFAKFGLTDFLANGGKNPYNFMRQMGPILAQ